jgi:hypothetical protein
VKLVETGYSRWLVLAASLLIALGVWRWARAVLVPSNTLEAQRKGIPFGNNSDLYPRWLGARELLLHGRDPYSTEITRESQIGFYGRVRDPQQPGEPVDVAAFAYPVPVVFLLAPTVRLPFETAQVIFRWVLLFSIAASVPLWMLQATGLRARWQYVLAGALLAVSSSAGISSFYKQNLSPLIILFLAGAAACAVWHRLALSGLLLALATIKPQISVLFIVFFIVWTIGNWRGRQRLLWSFSATMLGLFAASEALLPHWLMEFAIAARAYEGYSGETSILRVMFPVFVAHLIAAVLLAAFLVLCWKWRRADAGSEQFAWAMAWAGSVTLVIVPKLSSYNHPLLIPALLVLIAQRQRIWKAGLLARAFTKGAFACQLWQWGTAFVLGVLSLVLSPAHVRLAAGLPQYTLFALSPVTLLAVMVSSFAVARTGARTQAIPQTAAGQHG